ncbi:hypothetical protein [Streptomyces narbonensis]
MEPVGIGRDNLLAVEEGQRGDLEWEQVLHVVRPALAEHLAELGVRLSKAGGLGVVVLLVTKTLRNSFRVLPLMCQL